MEQLLQEEDLCICPEGTTCREPFVLRFSPLFAELADHIVPVAVKLALPMFHGTTARGYKSLDMIFLALNPTISYEIHFLDPICVSELRDKGMSATDIANMVQKKLSGALGYQCTSYSRRDKYSLLAGHDGVLQWS
ncbi:hypothetical protein KP509_29G074800 [Ceratopteris richardii]|nr:hypothetical protein KP509_29G074800 [Ceratopteris richardii]